MSRWGWGPERAPRRRPRRGRRRRGRVPPGARPAATALLRPDRIVGVEATTRRSQWRRAQSSDETWPACSRSKQPLVNPIRSPARRHPSTTGASRRTLVRPWPRGRTAAAARPPRPATARGGRSARCRIVGHRQAGREVSPGRPRRAPPGHRRRRRPGWRRRVRRLPTRRTPPGRWRRGGWAGRVDEGHALRAAGHDHVVEAQVVCAALGAVDQRLHTPVGETGGRHELRELGVTAVAPAYLE